MAYEVALGRTQLARLAPQSRLAVADSAFNESELRALGYDGHRGGAPPHRHAPQERGARPRGGGELARRKATAGGADLLFVGKVSPHKAPHDLVKMLSVLRRLYDPAARLHLVGSPLGETYEPALRAFVTELGLDDAVNFAGSVSEAELEAYLQAADVFVCASDHEGFCVPLAEAMGHGVPIVAYGVTAVPETVGDAGLLSRTSRRSASPPQSGASSPTARCASISRRPASPAPPGSTCPTRNDDSCRWSKEPSAPRPRRRDGLDHRSAQTRSTNRSPALSRSSAASWRRPASANASPRAGSASSTAMVAANR